MKRKQRTGALLCALALVLCGCAAKTPPEEPGAPDEEGRVPPVVQPVEQEPVEELSEADGPDPGGEEPDGGAPQLDDTAYVGEYLDGDAGEPNLEIARGEDGNYIVQIGIYRLTFLSDGVGELTEEGMRFTATDASGAPIGGIITVDGAAATVTFTDSTWTYLENGTSFSYTKASDVPVLQD